MVDVDVLVVEDIILAKKAAVCVWFTGMVTKMVLQKENNRAKCERNIVKH